MTHHEDFNLPSSRSEFGFGIGIDWEGRYLRAVLDFVGAPQSVDLTTTRIDYAPGYSYGGVTGPIEESFSITWYEGTERHDEYIEDVHGLVKSFKSPDTTNAETGHDE